MSSRRETPQLNQDPVEAARWEFSEAWHAGENPDVDAFCSRHPECGPELREKIQDFLFVAQRLPGVDQADRHGDVPAALPAKPMHTGMILGDFRIVQEIGRGGQGVVYEAEQISLRRRVALKVLPSHLSLCDDAVGKFRREAEAGGRQKHPGIVAVHAMGEFDGIHYIAHELVEGGRSLADRLDELRIAGDLPVGYFREAAGLAADVADALHHAHQSGVIHRDVKPSNILLDGDSRPKVTDFGLARVEDALALSRTGDFSGTPYYMSPEQAGRNRKGIDLRTDVYSLGVTLYEMLTLAVPFDAQTTPDVLRKILFDEPRDPRRENSRVPRDLAVICLKALEKKREHRYQDMAEFGDDLRRFLAGETILARPAGALTRFGKRVRRNPALSGALGLAAAAVVALLVTAVVNYIENSRMNEKLDGQRLIAESGRVLGIDPGLALLLGCRGADHAPGREANNALISALAECFELNTFETGPVATADLSLDGLRVAIGLVSGVAEIRHSETRELLARIEGHCGAILDVEFSSDGQRVATASADGTVRIWDSETGTETALGVPMEHTHPVRAVAFSPDGTKVVSASNDMTAKIWDLDGNADPILLLGHTWYLSDADFSPDGEFVLTTSEGGSCRLWRASTGEELLRYRQDLYPRILCAGGFHPTLGQREIMAAATDGSVYIWSLGASALMEACFKHGETSLVDAAYGPNGLSLATAAEDGTIRVWNLAEEKEFAVTMIENLAGVDSQDEIVLSLLDRRDQRNYVELKGHNAGLRSIDFCTDSQKLVTTARDNTTRIWGTRSLTTAVLPEKGWENWKLSPRSDLAVQRSELPKRLRVVDLPSGVVITPERSEEDQNEAIEAVTIPIKIQKAREKVISPLPLETRRFRFRDPNLSLLWQETNTDECSFKECAVSMDSRKLAACTYRNNLKVWDLSTKKLIFLAEYGGDCDLLAFSPDHRILAMTLSDHTVRLVCVDEKRPYDERKEIARSKEHGERIRSLAFSSDGRKVLTASDDGTARIWIPFGARDYVELTGHGEPVLNASFSADGCLVATFSRDCTCRVWDASSGSCLEVFDDFEGEINSIDFSSDGNLLVVSSKDGTARIFDLESGGDPICLSGHRGSVTQAVFSADDRSILTASEDGVAALWNFEKKIVEAAYLPFRR